ncbi:MAG: hypothetical protein OSJ34_07425 [Muribaculaceae bacterium]|nr:hypothetical protein [Muribaculaceae bacterium]
MKKIMFSDKFGLTEAVLSGRKTQTRRVYKTPRNSYGGLEVENNCIITFDANGCEIVTSPIYKIGEVVAVAQRYRDFILNPISIPADMGWFNKLFVRADLMPHQIRITNVRVERLQDISDEDCMAEGVEKVAECENLYRVAVHHKSSKFSYLSGKTPREAYAALIDRISDKGTWDSNPYVFVYEFELIK